MLEQKLGLEYQTGLKYKLGFTVYILLNFVISSVRQSTWHCRGYDIKFKAALILFKFNISSIFPYLSYYLTAHYHNDTRSVDVT